MDATDQGGAMPDPAAPTRGTPPQAPAHHPRPRRRPSRALNSLLRVVIPRVFGPRVRRLIEYALAVSAIVWLTTLIVIHSAYIRPASTSGDCVRDLIQEHTGLQEADIIHVKIAGFWTSVWTELQKADYTAVVLAQQTLSQARRSLGASVSTVAGTSTGTARGTEGGGNGGTGSSGDEGGSQSSSSHPEEVPFRLSTAIQQFVDTWLPQPSPRGTRATAAGHGDPSVSAASTHHQPGPPARSHDDSTSPVQWLGTSLLRFLFWDTLGSWDEGIIHLLDEIVPDPPHIAEDSTHAQDSSSSSSSSSIATNYQSSPALSPLQQLVGVDEATWLEHHHRGSDWQPMCPIPLGSSSSSSSSGGGRGKGTGGNGHHDTDEDTWDDWAFRDPEYYFAREKGYFSLSAAARKKHNITMQTVTLASSHKCFGQGYASAYLESSIGYDTVMLNAFLRYFQGGFLYTPSLGELFHLGAAVALTNETWMDTILWKLFIILSAIVLHVFTTHAMALLYEEVHTRFIALQLESLARTQLLPQPSPGLLFAWGIIEASLFLAVALGMRLIFFSELVNDLPLSTGLFLITTLTEAFRVLTQRSRVTSLYFPRVHLCYAMVFYAYFLSYPFGFTFVAFVTYTIFTFHACAVFWNRCQDFDENGYAMGDRDTATETILRAHLILSRETVHQHHNGAAVPTPRPPPDLTDTPGQAIFPAVITTPTTAVTGGIDGQNMGTSGQGTGHSGDDSVLTTPLQVDPPRTVTATAINAPRAGGGED